MTSRLLSVYFSSSFVRRSPCRPSRKRLCSIVRPVATGGGDVPSPRRRVHLITRQVWRTGHAFENEGFWSNGAFRIFAMRRRVFVLNFTHNFNLMLLQYNVTQLCRHIVRRILGIILQHMQPVSYHILSPDMINEPRLRPRANSFGYLMRNIAFRNAHSLSEINLVSRTRCIP